jgi:6-phosphogluconate dehydrogenase|tara:strand:+ start:11449 stop:12345 length:897 start_codon:yes stop_codon:yes gene_type:complete
MKQIGFIGLGRMGFAMSERLLKHKYNVVAYNRSPDKTKNLAKKGATPTFSYDELLKKLPKKKIVWLMLPSGKPTNNAIKKLINLMDKRDIIIDGANDFYKNAEEHSKLCEKKGIYFFDCGVSGGTHGLKNGYTLMIGGPKDQFKHIEPFCKALSPKRGYGYFGPNGSGHYVKSVHNIIEYVYLQGLAEGVELLDKKSPKIDIKKAIKVWQPSSVIKSWLLDLTNTALNRKDFNKIKPDIGSVTIEELLQTKKSMKGYTPAFDTAVKIRKDKNKKRFALGKRTIAAVRNEFGGHKVKKQ